MKENDCRNTMGLCHTDGQEFGPHDSNIPRYPTRKTRKLTNVDMPWEYKRLEDLKAAVQIVYQS